MKTYSEQSGLPAELPYPESPIVLKEFPRKSSKGKNGCESVSEHKTLRTSSSLAPQWPVLRLAELFAPVVEKTQLSRNNPDIRPAVAAIIMKRVPI